MTPLQRYDLTMESVCYVKQQGESLIRQAEAYELELERSLGLATVPRDPGFPCWTIEGVSGYFNDPRSALEAKEKQG